MSEMIRGLARFMNRENDAPITGDQHRVRVFDKDLLQEDFLGETGLDKSHAMAPTPDIGEVGPLETRPDIYVVLYRDDEEIFRSQVSPAMNFLHVDPVTGQHTKLTQDLGTFTV